MTKPVGSPAVVKEFAGNPFDLQTKTKNAVILLSNNTVWLKNNFVLENFLHDVVLRDKYIAAYDMTPRIELQAALDEKGQPLNGYKASTPVLLHQFETSPYDPRKMGGIALVDRDKLIVLHTHYHAGKNVAFSKTAFQKALVDYCHLVTFEKRQSDPVIIPMPGLDCVDTRQPGTMLPTQEHVDLVKEIIANTMFSNANVTLIMPK